MKFAIGDRCGEGTANGNLGTAYSSMGNHQTAIDYLEKSLKIAIEIGDRRVEEVTYGNLGSVYYSLGDYRKATEYHEKSLKIT